MNNKTYKDLVYRVPIEKYADVTENAILTNQYGIYISYGEEILQWLSTFTV